MFDFEHNWYLGHVTDPRFLQEIQSTGLRHSIEDSRINQFQITKETLPKILEDLKTGNNLHHGQKGISIVQLPKLPGQKDYLLTYLIMFKILKLLKIFHCHLDIVLWPLIVQNK